MNLFASWQAPPPPPPIHGLSVSETNGAKGGGLDKGEQQTMESVFCLHHHQHQQWQWEVWDYQRLVQQ